MQLFYTQELNQETLTLKDEEHRHCTKSLRKKLGDTIIATDGLGLKIEGVITEINRHETILEVKKKDLQEPRGFKIHLAIAPTKNLARFEWFLEKSTELGIDYIHPVFCRYSERKTLKLERGKKILLSAMKQSQQFYLPKLMEPVSFKEFVSRNHEVAQKYIAYVDFQSTSLQSVHNKGEDAIVLIGPEGGFSKEELDSAIAESYKKVSLGQTRLRTETAGIAACHIINLVNA